MIHRAWGGRGTPGVSRAPRLAPDALALETAPVVLPSERNRTDKARLLEVLGISDDEYVARFTSPVHTDWVMRCTARKVPRASGGAGRAAAGEGAARGFE